VATTTSPSQIYIIWGPPGTGKTTYLAGKTRDLVDWARRWHPESTHPVMLCSLTRAAAAEIAGRDLPLPRECVGTLHSHAYRALGRPPLAEAHIQDFNEANPDHRLLLPNQDDAENPEWDRLRYQDARTQIAQEYHCLRARQIDRRLWRAEVRQFAQAWESWKNQNGYIDYTDMIEHALRDVPTAPDHPHVIIADEAQDLSALEFALLRRWGDAAGRLIITGDPYQALYVWRGSHPEIFLDPAIPATRRRILSQSYRVPRAVHAVSMRWIRQLSNYQTLDYHPRDADGAVKTCGATWKAPAQAIDLAEEYLAAGKSVMLAASCSFFLPPTLAMLRQRGIPFANPWRTKRGDWNPLVRRGTSMAHRILAYLTLDQQEGQGRWWTAPEIHQWVDVLEAQGLLRRGAKAAIRQRAQQELVAQTQEGTEPRPLFPDALAEWFEDAPLWQMIDLFLDRNRRAGVSLLDVLDWWAGRLLGSKRTAAAYPLRVVERYGTAGLKQEPRCYVGTIHSFKGAEADVVILYPDLSPAGMRAWNRVGEPRDSVIRLFYVGLTRARETLIICRQAGAAIPCDWVSN